MDTQKVELGHRELELLLSLEGEDKTVFTIQDAKKILEISDSSVRKILHQLAEKGRLNRIERGKYLLVPARAGLTTTWTEVSYLFLPKLLDKYYVSFWTALNYWDMTEQIPVVVQVATPLRKADLEFAGIRFKFITLSKKYFFGAVERKVGEKSFKIASKEKTIVDCLMHPEHCGGVVEVAKGLWNAREEIDWDSLFEIIEKISISSIRRRLGYILEKLNLSKKTQDKLKQDFTGFRWLDPSRNKEILKYSKKWGLKCNMPDEALTDWRKY